jgi:hypothetical protein
MIYLLGAVCAVLSLSGLLVAGLLWNKSAALGGAVGGAIVGLFLEAFRFGASRWARFTDDPD